MKQFLRLTKFGFGNLKGEIEERKEPVFFSFFSLFFSYLINRMKGRPVSALSQQFGRNIKPSTRFIFDK